MKKLIFIFLGCVLISCGKEEKEVFSLHGDAFGTTYSIQYYSNKLIDAERGIDSVIHAVNKSVSTYMPNSDISKINQGDSTVVVDSIFKQVFRISETVYTNSQGYFDPTIGVLRNAYGFGDTKPLKKMDSITLDSLMQYVGFRKVSLLKDGRVAKTHPEIYFDFNAVAKGYGIDCLGRYLESQGITDYLIELGGEVLAKGSNLLKHKPWIVGIENVDSNLSNRSYEATIQLENRAMASSGNYRKFRIDSLTGKKYVHTLNPLTGSADQSDVTSATVVAATCGEADAYATALMALGLEKSKLLLKETAGIEAYLTFMDSMHKPQVYMTENFRKLLVDSLGTNGK
ncbi:thiamine biosynthesis lipoprotein [Ulvibacter sp. MAR_2010_11]|uniref:FAD:protein FMN transferase n=1 Tax=Ulvibacter sp. MAR_2010_11 TaxID=1250229 RepID=UPI000C2CB939|nr:FAD:protein FMN transferase [Ulvibacter sp. MAR_2010_11]PKA82302.1 thiamine biosynthesis lipoprotein [Ulvibacter sp. MAR_2010_11]